MDAPRAGPGLEQLRIDRGRRPAGRKASRARLLAALAVLTALGIGAFVVLGRPPAVTVVAVREARPGEQATALSAAGYIASRRRSIVAPKIAGRLDKVYVEEGQKVQEGEVLARLDDDDARVAVEQAVAQARNAEAQLAAVRAELAQVERELERDRRLAATGAISPEALETSQTAARTTEARRGAASAALVAAQRATDAARLQLDQTIVRAPFTGTVVRKLADEGAVLAPAAVSDVNVGGIVEMVDLGALEVEAEVSEDQLARISEGQPTLIFLDAFPERVYRGRAGTVRPAIDRSKATAVVKVAFADPPQGALPDMGAKVSFLFRPLDAAALADEPRLRAPASAVVEQDGQTVLFAVDAEGRVHRLPVEVAGRVGDEATLREGPPPGTQVVAAPPPNLRDGQRVRVRSPAS